MFFGQIEREYFSENVLSIWQQNKLPYHLQSLVDREQQEQEKCDIWELQGQDLGNKSIHLNFDRNFNHSIKS